jgi:hypothetical protein
MGNSVAEGSSVSVVFEGGTGLGESDGLAVTEPEAVFVEIRLGSSAVKAFGAVNVTSISGWIGSSGLNGATIGSDVDASPDSGGATGAVAEETETSSAAFAKEANAVHTSRVDSSESTIRFLFFIVFSPNFFAV